MIVVNFSHPLTPEQVAALERVAGRPVERVIAAPAQFDEAAPFGPQVAALVESAGLSGEEWQTAPLVINLPGHAAITAGVLAHLHGLRGHFPPVLRLRRADALGIFAMAELIDLQGLRDGARGTR